MWSNPKPHHPSVEIPGQDLNDVSTEMVDISFAQRAQPTLLARSALFTANHPAPLSRIRSNSFAHRSSMHPSTSSLVTFGSRASSRITLVKRPSESVLMAMSERISSDHPRPVSGESLESNLDLHHSRLSSLTSSSDCEGQSPLDIADPQLTPKLQHTARQPSDTSTLDYRREPPAFGTNPPSQHSSMSLTLPKRGSLREAHTPRRSSATPGAMNRPSARSVGGHQFSSTPSFSAPDDSLNRITRNFSGSSTHTLKLQPHQKYRMSRAARKPLDDGLDWALRNDLEMDEGDVSYGLYDVPTAGSGVLTPLPGLVGFLRIASESRASEHQGFESKSRTKSDSESKGPAPATQLHEPNDRPRRSASSRTVGSRALSVKTVNSIGSVVSATRDVWLPPKDPMELHRHELEIAKRAEQNALREAQEAAQLLKQEEEHQLDEQKWFKLSLSANFKKASRLEVKLLAWKSPFPVRLRYTLTVKHLQYHFKKTTSLKQDEALEKFEGLASTLDALDMSHKHEELRRALEALKRLPMFQDVAINFLERFERLVLMLTISRPGLLYGDELVIGMLLVFFADRTLKEVFELVQLFKFAILNERFVAKLTKALGSGAVKRLLSGFPEEVATISSRTLWVVWTVCDRRVAQRFLELLVVLNDHKLAVAYLATVIKYYHFGWVRFTELEMAVSKPVVTPVVSILDDAVFVTRLKTCLKLY